MATLSSPGIGSSGLNVKEIVSSLVALEKKPLESLKLQAATVQTRISTFGQIKSLVSAFSDAASKLASVTGWNAVSTSSSDSKFVSATAIGGTLPTSFAVEVQALAKAQSTASAALPAGVAVGAGMVRLEVGKWSGSPPSFTPGSGAAVPPITISATDKLADIASKINGANAGVTAAVLSDASGERLLLNGKNTGEDFGFRLSVLEGTDTDPFSAGNTDAVGLSRLVNGATMTQQAENARATVNGLAVTSSSNTFANTVSGVTFKAEQVTTGPITVSVSRDTATARKNIEDFVKAYNDINQILNEALKYDAGTKTAGLLQGDSTAIGLQNSLRNALQSVNAEGGLYQRLADVGITQQRGGELSIDNTKLSKALEAPENVRSLFRSESGNNGIAERVRALSTTLLATDGFFRSKEDTLKLSLQRNTKEQARVGERADSVEAQLLRRFNALDSQLTKLNGLNAYIAQQVTTWNNMKG